MYITWNTNVTIWVRPHGNKTFKFEFRNRTTKLSNQNAVSIRYDVIIGWFFRIWVHNYYCKVLWT